jgi:hypothetical protein
MTTNPWLPAQVTTNSTGSGFLDPDKVTDSLAQDFINRNDKRVTRWLELVDGELLSVAQEREVPLTSIVMPLHKKILEYCTNYFCFLCFQDSYGRTDVQITSQETIKQKLDWYEGRCEKLRAQLTKEMFLYANISLLASQRTGGTFSIQRA